MRSFLSSAWAVFLLFAIPIGGGIPAGVLLAQKRHLAWPVMEVLYLLSDVALACVFEPVMLAFIAGAKRSEKLRRFGEAMSAATKRATAPYGSAAGPLALILIAFGVDPMTGRAAARAAGHGFVTGWALAITGDMLYFSLIMVSTLWLRSVLGNGTVTMVVVLVAMMIVPGLIRRLRERVKKPS